MLLVTLDLLANILFKLFMSVHGRDWSEHHAVFVGFCLTVMCGLWISVPPAGIEPVPLQCKCRVSTTGPPGNPYLLGFGMRFGTLIR